MKHGSKRLWSILLTLVMLFSLVPGMSGKAYAASTTVTWNNNDITGRWEDSFTKDGVTITAGMIDFEDKNFMEGGTFTTTLGNFTKIEVSAMDVYRLSGTGWSVSRSKATWTGNATSVSFSGNIMGVGRGVTFVFTIETPSVAVTGVTLNKTETTLTVGGTETLTATVAPDTATDKTVTWASDNTAVATVANGLVTAVAPGTANITVTTTDGSKQATCAVTVNKADPTAPTGLTATYGQTLADVALPTGWTWADSTQSVGNAGSNTFKASFAENDNYNAASNVDVTVTVNKAANPATVSGTASVTAGGHSVDLANNVTLNGAAGTVSYEISGEANGCTLSGSVLTSGSSAGSVTVNVTVAEDDNYNALAATPITVTVNNKLAQTVTASDVTATYGDTGKSVSGTTNGDGAISYSVKSGDAVTVDGSTGALTIVKAGTAVVTVTAAETVTYAQASRDVTVTVNKAEPSYTAPTDLTATYGQTLAAVTLPTGWIWADSSQNVGNVGTNTFKANYTPSDTTNYNTVSDVDVSVTVSKADPSYTAPTGLTATYGDTLADVTLPTGWAWADSAQSVGNAGTNSFKAIFTPADTANYNTVSNIDLSVTVNKAAITITADDKSSKYGEDIAELTYQVGGAYKAGDELGVTLNTTATKTSDVGEYPITVSWNENANYTATVTNGKYTITKTGLTVTATGYTGAYDGAAHGITVDVGSSGATVYYAAEALTAENYATAGSTTNPTYTDAGEYTVYFYVVSGNYDPDTVSGSKTVSISKATGTATDAQKPTAKTDLVADNTDQALVTAPASLPEGYTAIQYSLDGETWTDAVPTGKDAGDYTVNYKYVGDSNHNDFQGEPLTVTIKTLTVTFEVNGGSAVTAQNVIKGEKATKPDDPTKAGNAFDGWFQDATFSVAFDFETPITADMTLYAKWTPNDYSFQTITGTTTDASHSWTKGSGKDVVITVKLTTEPDNSFAHFTGVQIDGKTLTRDTDYTAREGSTIVTLKAATLQKLSTGAHTVTIVFDNGTVDVRLTVKPNPSSPATGDTRTTGLWATLTILSGLGIGGVTVFGKKRRKSIGQ